MSFVLPTIVFVPTSTSISLHWNNAQKIIMLYLYCNFAVTLTPNDFINNQINIRYFEQVVAW